MIYDAQLKQIGEFLHNRRPQWKFVLEDQILRILTHQYVVDWKIIMEICKLYNLEIIDVMSHSTFGLVITVQMPAGE